MQLNIIVVMYQLNRANQNLICNKMSPKHHGSFEGHHNLFIVPMPHGTCSVLYSNCAPLYVMRSESYRCAFTSGFLGVSRDDTCYHGVLPGKVLCESVINKSQK